MMKSSISFVAILLSTVSLFTSLEAVIEYAKSSDNALRTNWLGDNHRHRIELFKKWLGNKPSGNSAGERAATPYDVLHPPHQFKGACQTTDARDRSMSSS